jgi:hypothetical protein
MDTTTLTYKLSHPEKGVYASSDAPGLLAEHGVKSVGSGSAMSREEWADYLYWSMSEVDGFYPFTFGEWTLDSVVTGGEVSEYQREEMELEDALGWC